MCELFVAAWNNNAGCYLKKCGCPGVFFFFGWCNVSQVLFIFYINYSTKQPLSCARWKVLGWELRPFLYALRWVLLKAGPRPTAPAAWLPGGPEARWPSPDLPQFFCPAVNSRACTDLHRVWACKMDDGEFEFVYHFNNHFNPIRPFLSLHVAKWKTLSFSVYSSVYRTR